MIKKYNKWYWRLYRWCKRELPYQHIYFTHGVKNLWKWFWVIWKDRNWDDHYIWEILKTKLKYQSKHIGGMDRHTTAKYDAERMMWCVRLIEKIQDEYYAGEYMDYHKSKYNWLDVEGNPELKQIDIEEISENYDDYFAKHKSVVRKILADKSLQIFELNDDNYKQRLAMNVGRYNEKRAQNILFTLLNRDIKTWWN